MRKVIYLVLITCFLQACQDPNTTTTESASRFFELYKDRTDWQGFQDLYAEDAVFEDVIFRFNYNKEDFITFYNWPDPLLKKHPDYPEALVLEELVVSDNNAVGRGYFTPFYYGDVLYDQAENMRFTMWLEFNKEGLITKHIDWIEYPPEFVISAMNRHLAADSISD